MTKLALCKFCLAFMNLFSIKLTSFTSLVLAIVFCNKKKEKKIGIKSANKQMCYYFPFNTLFHNQNTICADLKIFKLSKI